MTTLTPLLDSAFVAPRALIFGAFELLLPAPFAPLRLVDGSAVLVFGPNAGGQTFAGSDPAYGALASIDALTDGAGDNAPAVRIVLNPATVAGAVALAGASAQGSPARLWLGAVDAASGLVIADPQLIFAGELDTAVQRGGATTRQVELELVSGFERFFDNDEGARLSPGWHKALFPGETGLDQVTGIQNTLYWGATPPVTAPVTAVYAGGLPGINSRAFNLTGAF